MEELIARHGHCITTQNVADGPWTKGEIAFPLTLYGDDTVSYNKLIRAVFTNFLKRLADEELPTSAKDNCPTWTPFLELRNGDKCALSEVRLPIYYQATVKGSDLTDGFWYRVNTYDTYLGESLVLELNVPCADFVFIQEGKYYYAYHDSWEMCLDDAGLAKQSGADLEITWPTEDHTKFVLRDVLFEHGKERDLRGDEFVPIRL